MSSSRLPMTSPSWRRARSSRRVARSRSPPTSGCAKPISAVTRTRTMSRKRPMLSIGGLHVHFGKLHILQGVNIEVKPGECAALLGRNGVGKTTTLRAIMGLARKSGGSIAFDGFNLANCAPHDIPRRGIGYVPQGRGIFPGLTVQENLFIGLSSRRGDPEREDYVFACFPRLKERLKQP